MTRQLQEWQGEFGNEYVRRNQIDWQDRLPAFQHMLHGLSPDRVLEVGCNRGHNLVALSKFLEDADLVGVEPNQYALEIARAAIPQIGILQGNIFDIPFKNNYFDCVFTSGVLIHISLKDLPSALAEIYRVSKRYILAIEYFSEEEEVIQYRGKDELLWKRNFLKHYQSQFQDLALIQSGYWEAEYNYEKTHWWLMEKSSARPEK
jgi:pseudaminic acid biosynthesis-associated methylase